MVEKKNGSRNLNLEGSKENILKETEGK